MHTRIIATFLLVAMLSFSLGPLTPAVAQPPTTDGATFAQDDRAIAAELFWPPTTVPGDVGALSGERRLVALDAFADGGLVVAAVRVPWVPRIDIYRLDDEGETLWSTTLPIDGENFAYDAKVVAGEDGSVGYCDGVASLTLLRADGSVLWERRNALTYSCSAVALLRDGALLAAGWHGASNNQSQLDIIKVGRDGTVIWERRDRIPVRYFWPIKLVEFPDGRVSLLAASDPGSSYVWFYGSESPPPRYQQWLAVFSSSGRLLQPGGSPMPEAMDQNSFPLFDGLIGTVNNIILDLDFIGQGPLGRMVAIRWQGTGMSDWEYSPRKVGNLSLIGWTDFAADRHSVLRCRSESDNLGDVAIPGGLGEVALVSVEADAFSFFATGYDQGRFCRCGADAPYHCRTVVFPSSLSGGEEGVLAASKYFYILNRSDGEIFRALLE